MVYYPIRGCLWIRQGSLELEKHASVVAVKTLG